MAIHTDKLNLEQASNPLIYFKGTETADATMNLSTLNGAGNVNGPKDSGGWVFAGMVKIQVKDSGDSVVDRWIPHYIPG